MKIRCMITLLALWCHASAVTVAAQDTSDKIQDYTAVTDIDPDLNTEKPVPDHEAVAEYEKALRLEKELEKKLNALRRIEYDASSVTSRAAMLTASLRAAENAAMRRAKALAGLQETADAASESRISALEAVSAYRTGADEALKAIAAFVRADNKSAGQKSRLADATLDKKATLRLRAEHAISAVVVASSEYIELMKGVLAFDDDVKKSLSNARGHGENIITLCNSLTENVANDKPELVFAMNKSLAGVRTKVDGFIKRNAEAVSVDIAAYQRLHTDLQEMIAREEKQRAVIEEYFEATVTAVVKNESRYYLTSLWSPKKADKVPRKDLDAASASLIMARTGADKALAELEKSSRVASDSVDKLVGKIERLPTGNEGIVNLINESSSLLSGFGEVEESIQAAVAAKMKEVDSARHATEKAYLLAFGHDRRERWATAAAPRSPAPVKEEPIQVQHHVYSLVYALKNEPAGYGAYTYVLFNQNHKDASEHIKKRYDAILKAILSSTSSVQYFTAAIARERLNLFCIPYKKTKSAKGYDEEYDSDLARSYLATAGSGALLRKEIISRMRMSPGPFLLTTRSRLSDGSSKSQLLFVDLSSYPSETYDSILAEYKNTLVVHPPAGQEVWTPPVTQRVIYAGISASNAIPGLMEKLRKIVDFFIPSAQASTGNH